VSILANFTDADGLVQPQDSAWAGLVLPRPGQSLADIPRVALELWLSLQESGERHRALVMVALDAISLPVAVEELEPPGKYQLTSMFPSTSAVGWLSSVTGVMPWEHGVAGVVYEDVPGEGLINVLASCKYASEERWLEVGDPVAPRMASAPTMFQSFAGLGAVPLVGLGDLQAMPGAWRDALLAGAQTIGHDESAADVDAPPSVIAKRAIAQIDCLLEQVKKADEAIPALVWRLANFDNYVHAHGYDAALRASLRELASAMRRWADAGHVILVYSDHGMTAARIDPAVLRGWEELNSPRYCRLPAGGAGLVRWTYARPECEELLFSRLTDVLSGVAIVRKRHQLIRDGLLSTASKVPSIVSIAIRQGFPAPVHSYVTEHGSLTPAEMLVPLLLWGI
jgi:Type I phosphodiesterase / nucleotide pyrophosphatase